MKTFLGRFFSDFTEFHSVFTSGQVEASQLFKRNRELETRIEQLENDLTDREEEYAKTVAALQTVKSASERKISEKNGQIESLEEKTQDLNTEIKRLRNQLNTENSNLKHSKNDMENLKMVNSDLSLKINALQSKLDLKDNEKNQVEIEIKRVEQALRNKESDYIKKCDDLRELHTQNEVLHRTDSEKVKELSAEVRKLQLENSNVTNQLTIVSQKADKDNLSKKSQLEKCFVRIKELEEKWSDSKGEKTNSESKVFYLQRQLSMKVKEMEAKEKEKPVPPPVVQIIKDDEMQKMTLHALQNLRGERELEKEKGEHYKKQMKDFEINNRMP